MAGGIASTAFGVGAEAGGMAATAFGYVGTKKVVMMRPALKQPRSALWLTDMLR